MAVAWEDCPPQILGMIKIFLARDEAYVPNFELVQMHCALHSIHNFSYYFDELLDGFPGMHARRKAILNGTGCAICDDSSYDLTLFLPSAEVSLFRYMTRLKSSPLESLKYGYNKSECRHDEDSSDDNDMPNDHNIS